MKAQVSDLGLRPLSFVSVTPVVRAEVDRQTRTLWILASNDEFVGGPEDDPVRGVIKFLVIQWAFDGLSQGQAVFPKGTRS